MEEEANNKLSGAAFEQRENRDRRRNCMNQSINTRIKHQHIHPFIIPSIPSSSSSSVMQIQSFSVFIIIIVLSSLFLSFIPLTCSGFNLEPRLPIIKRGDINSYFGYSVAQHLIQDETRGRIVEAVLLVGAPQAQSSQPGTNHSGVVYKCSLTTHHSDCVPIRIDQDEKAPGPDVSKDDQWLGVSVKSQGPGGFVTTCAHRHIVKGVDFQWGQGICYSLTQFLDFQRVWEPCFNRPVNKAHEEFGYCQAGTSVDISEDHDIVIGSPGPYTWRGTIFTNSIRFAIRDDKTWYFGPLLENTSPVDKYSYLGMSVTSGKFFGDKMSFVGGAPRSNGNGQVIFHNKAKPSSVFNIELILDGEQFASSFGYTLTSMDTNGDGKLDLIVGAPFYYTKSEGGAVYVYLNSPESLLNMTYSLKLTGKPESRFGFSMSPLGDINKDGFNDLAIGAPYTEEGGTVYVYLGSKDGIRKEPAQIIHSTDLPTEARIRSTFGYSLSGGMDLDQNDYPDLLIGSYDSNAVALLRGRPIINIITTVKGKLKNINPFEEGCEEDRNSKLVCFAVEACFKFNATDQRALGAGGQGSSRTPILNLGVIKLAYRIEAETFTGKKYYRVKFQTTQETDRPNIVEKDIVIRAESASRDFCSKEVVYLKDKSDIQNAIKFKLTYALVQQEPRMPKEGEILPEINKYPILNQEEAHKIFEARFLKDCGTNDVCESDLILSAELHLPANKFENDSSTHVLLLGEENVNLTLSVMNRNEPAYEANVFITHSASLSFVGRKILKGESVECLPQSKTLLRCELGNPFKKGETKIQLRFNPKAILDDEQKVTFGIEVNTTSADISPHKNTQNLTAKVVRKAELELRGSTEPDQVFYGGEVRGESSMVYEEDVGSLLVHTYVVTNRGPWKARRVEVAVEWPYEVENGRAHGKWLLYLLETQVQGSGYCDTEDFVNPLKLRKMSDHFMTQPVKTRKRPKREVIVAPEEVREDGKTVNIVTMDCLRKTAKCIKFSCYLSDLKAEQTAVIKIRARLWNSTFVEDYAHGVNQVHINSHARIKIDPALDIQQHRLDNDFATAKTKAYPDLPLLPPQEAPIWIIVLAIILGILLLVVLVAILYKLGFFERKKFYGYLSANDDDKADLSGYN